ncbi:PaaI family thioesterase [Roseinatronobacter alkalisoli]|uniref:Medium/long-chain acyl-CoA thioesterase YigI n=1 Tax=Roseinatronobacter alkalisoli TaxID=3028235 RepID=A0ABT5TDU6_9RHOB|nr:PaaI family thioesterase [Roseinatronobacter sp. HJB301]MDD7973285.1 PaaI family thioesterase [Roseinatronobacter sp. HJB301]
MTHIPALKGWKSVNIAGFMELVGPLLRSTRSEEKNTYGLQTTNKHQNQIGLVHGGVMTTLLDQVIAIVAWEAVDRQPIVTVQMDTTFLGSAKSGDFLEVRATIRHMTRTLMFVEAEINCGLNSIARASAIMKISYKAVESK